MESDYINVCKEFINKTDDLDETYEEYNDFVKKLFFMYPTLKINKEILHGITTEISEKFNVPYRDIKVIGSSHTGFSFIDKKKTGQIKKYTNTESDIDIAIINTNMFIDLLEKTTVATKNYKDLTGFTSPDKKNQFMRNIKKGFIRPDTLGCSTTRVVWENFYSDLTSDYNLKISGAVYLSEIFFTAKINKQLEAFKNIKEVQDELK